MIKNLMEKFEIKELLKFCVGGGSAVIVDYIVYLLLKMVMEISMAKALSFIAGAIVGFLINKYWTFNSPVFKGYEVIKYVFLYACSATVNTFVNDIVLGMCGMVAAAFIAATGCSTIINFLGQKFFVFRKKSC